MNPRPLRASRAHDVPQTTVLDAALQRGIEALLAQQDPKGFWVHELEADATITVRIPPAAPLAGERRHRPGGQGGPSPAVPAAPRRRLAHLRERAGQYQCHGQGLLRLEDGRATPRRTPRLVRACRCVRDLGGITEVNIFTRILLALFGELDWKGVPCMPVEIMLLPRWFYFNLYEISYWSRTVLIPLLIIFAHRPVRPAPAHAHLDELYLVPRDEADLSFPRDAETFTWRNFFLFVDRCLRLHDRLVRQPFRQRAIRMAERWMLERMQGNGGLGGIFPAMANAVIALTCLGYRLGQPGGRSRPGRDRRSLPRHPRHLPRPALPLAGLGHRPHHQHPGRGGPPPG